MDDKGNVVCHTLDFGHGVGLRPSCLSGTGIVLNNHTNWMDPRPGRGNSLGAGKRPMAGYAPTLACCEGEKLRLAIGSPGSYRIPTAVAQVLLNLLYREIPLEEAVEGPPHAPRRRPPPCGGCGGRHGFGVRAGKRFQCFAPNAYPHHFFGGVHAVQVEDGGHLTAFGDPRRAGRAGTRE